jgi:rare lipoprotein A
VPTGVTPPSQPPAAGPAGQQLETPPVAAHGQAAIDHSGRQQTGKASWYGEEPAWYGEEPAWYGEEPADRKMANGRRMDPDANEAASKTLPLGSTAKVTNLENGRSATVTIEDRGPFVGGRVVDASPHVAQELAIKKQGVMPVVVKPITVPQPNGGVKPGAGVAGASPQETDKPGNTTRQ